MAAKKRTRAVKAAGADEFSETMEGIRTRFGATSFRISAEQVQPERISTGVFILDFSLLGGIPHNRISMLVGERSAGKSTLADKIIANAQRQYPDQVAVKIDVEGTHDDVWSTTLGVDSERLWVFQPETGEAAVDAADALVRTKEVSIVVVDSIAALVPMKEVDSSAEDALVGLQSRLVGSMIRKVNAGLITERNRDHYVTVVFINQFRSKIGIQYGDPRAIPGGKALEFATSVQIIVKNKETMGRDAYDVESVVENEHSYDIKKNKINAGPRSGEFRIRRVPDPHTGLGVGEVDDASTLLAYAKKFGVYSGGGASWTLAFWNNSQTFRKMDEAVAGLYDDPELYWQLRNFLIFEQARHLGMPDEFLERFLPEDLTLAEALGDQDDEADDA